MVKRLCAAVVALLLIVPSFAFAAGFAKDPLFLSRSPVVEGQSVHVYAVISNPDTAAFVGTLVFSDLSADKAGNKVKIGSAAINVAAGGTQTASTLWTPNAGVHPLSAQLVAKDGTAGESISQSFTVDAKPAPTGSLAADNAAAVDSSAAIQKNISNLSPQVGSATAPAFGVIDNARNSIANTLDSQIANARQKVNTTPKPGIVAGDSTQDVQVQNPTTGFWYWLYTAYLYALLALRWLVGSAAIFYPFIALLFLYALYRMYRRYRRPY